MTGIRWTVFADRFPLAAPAELGHVVAASEHDALQLARTKYKRRNVLVQRAHAAATDDDVPASLPQRPWKDYRHQVTRERAKRPAPTAAPLLTITDPAQRLTFPPDRRP